MHLKCCQKVYQLLFLSTVFDTDPESYPSSIWGKKYIIFSMGRGWQGTVNSSALVNCRENLSLRLLSSLAPPSSSSSSLPFFLSFSVWEKPNATDATEWKMKRYHGLQSTSSALPKSFHLLPPKSGEARKQEAKTGKQKHQRQSGPYLTILLNFFPPTHYILILVCF